MRDNVMKGIYEEDGDEEREKQKVFIEEHITYTIA
jgi:hypothetical protein